MFKGNSDHIVFVSSDINQTRQFYEKILGLIPTTAIDQYVTYKLGMVHLCFKEIKEISNLGSSVVHIGIDFPSRLDVDTYFSKIRLSGYYFAPEAIIGGPGTGPYRFYVKDPDGYTLEFESWENSSD